VPFPFDATLKDIVRSHTADYAAALGAGGRPARLLDVDLSTLSAATDVAFGFGEPLDEILDVNFQAGADRRLAARTEMYRAVLHHQYQVPVRTLIVLLRPAADHAHLTGQHSYGPEANRVECRYEVLRLWQQPPELFLDRGAGLLPLATLARLPDDVAPEAAVAEIVRRIDERLTGLPEGEGLRILTGVYVLASLRVRRGSLSQIFGRYGMIKHTNAYDEMVYLGELRAFRRIIIRQGQGKFGAPTAEQQEALTQIEDDERLERILDAVPKASGWDELLAVP
jgi:hypothetical protein